MRVSHKVFGGVSICAGSLAVAAASHAAPPSVTPPPTVAPLQVQRRAQVAALQQPVAQLQVQQINVSPDLKAAIARKRAYDPQLLSQRISYQGAIPTLKVKSGRSFQLEPTGPAAMPPAALQMKALPASVVPFKAHVEAPFVIGRRIIKLLDVTVSNMAHQTPVKDQGGRGTCTAFASLGGLEARGKRAGVTRDLSENHAFTFFMAAAGSPCTYSGGYTTWKTGPVLTANGVCTEAQMPYTPGGCPPAVPAVCTSGGTAKLTSTTHFFTPEFGGTGLFRADNTNLLESFIKAGYDIVYGLNVAGNDWGDGTGDIDVQINASGAPAPSVGGHAMLLVGYNRNANYFVVKNSWGEDWGHDGYAHISYEYLQTYGKYGYAILDATVP